MRGAPLGGGLKKFEMEERGKPSKWRVGANTGLTAELTRLNSSAGK